MTRLNVQGVVNQNRVSLETAPEPQLPAVVEKRRSWYEPRDWTEALRMAEALSRSGIVPKAFVSKPQDIVTVMIFAQDLGISLFMGLRFIASINGTPAVWGDGKIALCQRHPAYAGHEEWFEDEAGNRVVPGRVPVNKLTAVCRVHRKTADGIRSHEWRFGYADAVTAKLWGKTGKEGQPTPWVTYPIAMLRSRAREAFDSAFADALNGLASAEVLQDVIGDYSVAPPAPPSVINGVGQEPQTQEPASVAPADPFQGIENGSSPLGSDEPGEDDSAECLDLIQRIENAWTEKWHSAVAALHANVMKSRGKQMHKLNATELREVLARVEAGPGAA